MTDAPTPLVLNLADDEGAALTAAAEAVAAGECIVVPTDTVYGIGADAFSSAAVQRLLDAKERGRDMPPPVLIAEPSMIRALASDVPPAALALAKKHWPGALTLILQTQRTLKLDIGETDGTIAVRVPDHEQTRALLRRTGPLAVSSANISGQPAATSCDEALGQLGDRVAVYLDGGETPGLTPSTIIDFNKSEGGRIVREGVLTHAVLAETATELQPIAGQEPEEPALEADTAAEDVPEVGDVPELADAEPSATETTN